MKESNKKISFRTMKYGSIIFIHSKHCFKHTMYSTDRLFWVINSNKTSELGWFEQNVEIKQEQPITEAERIFTRDVHSDIIFVAIKNACFIGKWLFKFHIYVYCCSSTIL